MLRIKIDFFICSPHPRERIKRFLHLTSNSCSSNVGSSTCNFRHLPIATNLYNGSITIHSTESDHFVLLLANAATRRDLINNSLV